MKPVPRWERSSPGLRLLRIVLLRWFVQYNPLYFASALCVLVGVYLVSGEIRTLGWRSERLLLVGVLEAYQCLVLAGAAFLLHVARERRPAVILALLELPFLFDWTFQTEALSTVAGFGRLASATWLVLALAKVFLLLRLFRIRLTRVGWLVVESGLTCLAALPHLLASTDNPGVLHLGGTWSAALALGALVGLRQVSGCFLVLDEWGRTVERRSLRAAAWIGAGLGMLHLCAAASQFHVHLTPVHAAPFVVVLALLARDEVVACVGAAIALVLAAAEPVALAPAAGIVAGLLAGCGRAWGRPRLHVAALLVAGFAAQLAGWTGGPWPALDSSIWGAAACGLAILAWRTRIALAWTTSGALLIAAVSPWADRCIPRSRLEWGVSLLGAGFVSLLAGVAVSWLLRARGSPLTRRAGVADDGADAGGAVDDLG